MSEAIYPEIESARIAELPTWARLLIENLQHEVSQTEVYLIEKQEMGDDGASVVAVYVDRELAEAAAALDTDTSVRSVTVSEWPARVVDRLSLERMVLVSTGIRFRLETPLMKGETVERHDDIVSYGSVVTEGGIRELRPFGWNARGDGEQGTILLVHASGVDHPAVRARFAQVARQAEAMGALVTDDRGGDDYSDLVPGATVTHPKYGEGIIVDVPWLDGQPEVMFPGGARVRCNPDRLSTDD